MKQKTKYRTILTASCLLATAGILAAPGDTQTPEAASAAAPARPQAPAQHGHHRRGPKQLALSIADDAQVVLWKPDLSTQLLEIRQGKVGFKGTGVDNYHALVAERTGGTLTEVAIRYEYARGKPSGHSSTELTAANKSALEIVPDPIPREHYHYHSDQSWGFIVRFQGQPVANKQVMLETANGSRLESSTAADGRVSLHLPDDFPGIVEGARDKRSAEFAVSTKHTEGGRSYQTTLNGAYRVNPQHWHSLGLGIMVAGMGMLTGGFIGRKGLGKKKQDKRP